MKTQAKFDTTVSFACVMILVKSVHRAECANSQTRSITRFAHPILHSEYPQ